MSIDSAEGPFSWVVALDSANWGARWHRALLDASRISPATLRAHIDALLAGHADGYIAEEMRLFVADTGRALLDHAAKANSTVLFDAAWRRAVFRRDIDGALQLLTTMAQGDRPRFEQAKGRYLAAALHMGRGHIREALPLLPLPRPTIDDGEGLIIAVTASIASEIREGALHADSLTRTVSEWQRALQSSSSLTPQQLVTSEYLLGLLAANRGDTRAAEARARTLDGVHDDRFAPQQLAHVVRALSAIHAGNCVQAIDHLDRATTDVWLGTVASSAASSGGFERLLRARCMARQGRHHEAITWLVSLERNSLYDLAFLAPALRAQVESFRALGDQRSADEIEKRLSNW